MQPLINNHSAFGIANGAFQTILAEAQKTTMPEPVSGGNVGGANAPKDVPQPGSNDPLQLGKIEVKGPLQPGGVQLGDEANVKLCDERAKKFGFKDFGDFMQQIAKQCDKEGLTSCGHAIPVPTIALALLSTDAASSVDVPQSTQKGGFDEFEVLEAGNGEELSVKTGSVLVPKNDLDQNKLLQVAGALAKLVMAGRLEESQIYAYANSRSCDVHDTQDMAGAARTCLSGLRNKLESSELVQRAREEIKGLRATPKDDVNRAANLAKAEKLERALEAYCKKLDAVFPRDIVPTKHTSGRRKGKPLENEVLYLEAQTTKLTDWLKETYSRPPNVKVLYEAENTLKQQMVDILDVKSTSLPKSEGNLLQKGPLTKFVTEDLRKQVQILRNQVKLAHELAGDAEVRKAQELSLTKFAQNHGGRILPQRYTLDLGVSGGILLGVSASTNIKVGAGYNYKMTIDVDHAGKVTVLSIHGPKGEISVSGGVGGVDAKLGLSGGFMFGKALVYDNVQDFLKNSATDLRVRLHAGGYFHFGSNLNVLSRKVDNTSFSALLKENGVIRETDEFVPKAVSKTVTDEISVEREHVSVSGRFEGGQKLAHGHGGLKFESVRKKKITSDPRFTNVTDLAQMGSFQSFVRFADTNATQPHEIAQSLADEYADFCQAVRYDAWQKSWGLRKFLNRHTAQIAPPKMSLQEHLFKRFPKLATQQNLKINDDLKAAYLASLAATGAATKLALLSEPESPAKKAGLEKLEKLQQNVLQPDFKISVGARRKWLYTSTETDLGRTMSFGGEVAANANLHLPVVNLLGADMLGGLAPGVKFSCNYQHRLSAEKTGLPHLDQDRFEFTIGTNGIQAERIITALVTSILDKVGVKDTLSSTGIALGSPLIGPGLSILTNVATGSTGSPIDPTQRFKDTKVNLDALLAKVGLHIGGDSGIGLRVQLVKSPDGGWKFESVQSVNYSELTVDANLSVMSPAGLGGYVAVNGGYGSTSVMGERLYGNSLAPFVRVAGEFNLNSPNRKEEAWNAFLANNDKGIEELASGLRGYAETEVQDTPVSAELVRYMALVDGLKEKGNPHLGTHLKEKAKALARATTPEERRVAATELLQTLGKITAQQLKEHPPVKGGKHVKLSEDDVKAMKINDELDKPIDVDLAELQDVLRESRITEDDFVVIDKKDMRV